MSLVRLPPAVPRPAPTDDDIAPRRGRPPARNEILRAGRLGGLAPEELASRFGTPLYVYDLDVIERQVAVAAGRPAARSSTSPMPSRPIPRSRSSPTSAVSGSARTSPRPASWRPRSAPASSRVAS